VHQLAISWQVRRRRAGCSDAGNEYFGGAVGDVEALGEVVAEVREQNRRQVSLKFLIDECLSPELVRMAHDRGHFA